jgi:hypothetical protein
VQHSITNSPCTLIWTSCASPNSIPENSLEQPGFACKRQFRGESTNKHWNGHNGVQNQIILAHHIGFQSFIFLSCPFLFLQRCFLFSSKYRFLCHKSPARELSVSTVDTGNHQERGTMPSCPGNIPVLGTWKQSRTTHLVKTFLLYLPHQNLSQVAYNTPQSRYSMPWTRELSDYDYLNYSEPSFRCTDI